MRVTITVEVELERISGKFASKSDVVDQLIDELERSQPSDVSGIGADGDSAYEIVDWAVSSPDA